MPFHFAGISQATKEEVFLSAVRITPPETSYCNGMTEGGCTAGNNLIYFGVLSSAIGQRTAGQADIEARNNVVHELGHAFANIGVLFNSETGPYSLISRGENFRLWTDEGFAESPVYAKRTWRQHPTSDGGSQQHEAFADMFLAWVYNRYGIGGIEDIGGQRRLFMESNMNRWITMAANR